MTLSKATEYFADRGKLFDGVLPTFEGDVF
jgi:hypothetical protein